MESMVALFLFIVTKLLLLTLTYGSAASTLQKRGVCNNVAAATGLEPLWMYNLVLFLMHTFATRTIQREASSGQD